MPRHVVVLVAIQLAVKVVERRADLVRHQRQETTHQRPHDKVIENLRLGRCRHHGNLVNQLEILHLDGRVVVNAKGRYHVLDGDVDGQRVRSRLDVVQPEDLRHRVLLPCRLHGIHDAPLEPKEIVNEILRLGICAGFQAVVDVSNEFLVRHDDLRMTEESLVVNVGAFMALDSSHTPKARRSIKKFMFSTLSAAALGQLKLTGCSRWR
jgi:hypothetical protein